MAINDPWRSCLRRLPLVLGWWCCCCCCCIVGNNVSRYPLEDLGCTVETLADSRKDIGMLLPLKLDLTLRHPHVINYSRAIELLLQRLEGWRRLLQRAFHNGFDIQGFLLSDDWRFKVEGPRFSFYYHVGYLGTNSLVTLQSRVKGACRRSLSIRDLSKCTDVTEFPGLLEFSLVLLSSFRQMPNDGGVELNGMFMEFNHGSTGLVSANINDEHGVNRVLCHEYLQCAPNFCNLSAITVDPLRHALNKSVWTRFPFLAPIAWEATGSLGQASALDAKRWVQNISSVMFSSQQRGGDIHLGVYRAWCVKTPTNLGHCPSPGAALIIWSAVLFLLRTLVVTH